jgi:hypothetical protein
MLTQSDLQAIAKLIKIEVDSVRKDIANMATKDDITDMATKSDLEKMATKKDIESLRNDTKSDIERLDMKISTYFEINKKEHGEIMEMLVESNEEHGKRLDRLEVHTGLVKPHKN